MSLSRRDVITAIGRACDVGNASVFVGAGLSKLSGLPDWISLLTGPGEDSNVPFTAELLADLPLIAEYILVEDQYTRERLQQHMLDELTKTEPHPKVKSPIVV